MLSRGADRGLRWGQFNVSSTLPHGTGDSLILAGLAAGQMLCALHVGAGVREMDPASSNQRCPLEWQKGGLLDIDGTKRSSNDGAARSRQGCFVMQPPACGATGGKRRGQRPPRCRRLQWGAGHVAAMAARTEKRGLEVQVVAQCRHLGFGGGHRTRATLATAAWSAARGCLLRDQPPSRRSGRRNPTS